MTQTITVEAQLSPAYTGQTASYKIYNVDGTQYANWTSSGVAELGTTGTYQAFSVSAPDAGGVVHWSVDGGSTDLGIVGEIKAAAPTAAAIRGEMDSNSTKLDVAVSSRLASASYTAAPTTAAIVAALMAEVVEGSKTYKEAFLDLWAVIVGDSATDDGDEPTSATYDSPDGSVQRTHAITETTRTVS